MSLYLQYHNCDHETIPVDELPFARIETGIHTSKKIITRAAGRVFLIVGVGRPKRFFLWQTFRIKELEVFEEGGSTAYNVYGPGWELAPPQELKGVGFERFKSSCANFVGFRRIDDLPYAKTLLRLANAYRPPRGQGDQARFIRRLIGTLRPRDPERPRLLSILEQWGDKDARALRERSGMPRLALSVGQPWAEAILRGKKKEEFRSIRAHVRGTVYLYASRKHVDEAEQLEILKDFGIRDVRPELLARGMLVGMIDIVGCEKLRGPRSFAWQLSRPRRFNTPIPPVRRPQPVWFRPF